MTACTPTQGSDSVLSTEKHRDEIELGTGYDLVNSEYRKNCIKRRRDDVFDGSDVTSTPVDIFTNFGPLELDTPLPISTLKNYKTTRLRFFQWYENLRPFLKNQNVYYGLRQVYSSEATHIEADYLKENYSLLSKKESLEECRKECGDEFLSHFIKMGERFLFLEFIRQVKKNKKIHQILIGSAMLGLIQETDTEPLEEVLKDTRV